MPLGENDINDNLKKTSNDASSNSAQNVDIRENELLHASPDLLAQLLRDHTTQKNITWATHDYESLGEGYAYDKQIFPELITGENDSVIMPRVLKTKQQQIDRSKDMAEVFTPSWICNAQNNLIDEAWFGRKDVFNMVNEEDHSWQPITENITFPKDKTWKDYVRLTRMEITCGEAPYLVSRYDTTTGDPIPLQSRIGLLDRKLRVISENTDNSGDWLDWAQIAYKNIYGYEWQGDNLLLAREALLYTFSDYYEAKFGKLPLLKSLLYMAYIISWNLWQMDGLKGVVPDSCQNGVIEKSMTFFGEEEHVVTCKGCEQDKIRAHNGIYCLIRDWGNKDPRTGENNRKIRYIDLIK